MARGALLLALAHLLAAHSHVGIEDALLDGVSIMSYQPLESVVTGEYINPHIVTGDGTDALLFSPPKLLFGARPLGMPHVERVTLINKLNHTIHLTSISGNTVHFHSSFFEEKAIPPNGNTSFNVVFLGRMEGTVDTSLFIHTSEGIYKYLITGTSIQNAYRLQPLLKIYLPHNASYAPLIYVHNPHDHAIQVTEVYSSGGIISLDLPGGGLDGPQALWLLPPHTTRPIIAVRYNPPVSSPHKLPMRDKESSQPYVAYVRIKLHGTASLFSSILVVAVQIFVSSDPGPYSLPQFIDFGLGGTKDPPKKVRLFMGNSSPRPVRITSIYMESIDGLPMGGLRVFTTAKSMVPPFSLPDVHIATLTLGWKQVYESGQCCGKIIINTRPDQKIEIPFTSQPLNGGLVMNDESVTRYLSSESGITAVRQVLLKNMFNVGIFVTDIIVGKDIEKHFEISAFYPQDFKVNTIQHGFRIQLKSWTTTLKFESRIVLVTNISSQSIPVYIYNGKLDLFMSILPRPSKEGLLDIGLVGKSSTTHAKIILRNSNPVAICLRGCGSDLPGAIVQLVGCSAQTPSALPNQNKLNITACTCVPAKWYAIYDISILAPANAAEMKGELWMATVHERLIVPVALTAANGGRLSQPEPSIFEDCFPGTICSFLLQIKSSYSINMDVISVEPFPNDSRIFFTAVPYIHNNISMQETSLTITSLLLNKIGWLNYDPYLYCDDKCYTGLDLSSAIGYNWLSRVTLPSDTLEMDTRLLNARYNIFTSVTSISPYVNMSIRVDTTQVRNHMFPIQIPLTWPRLYSGPLTIMAPLTQIGRSSNFYFNVMNPSQSRPILVQLILEWMVSDNERIQSLPNRLKPPGCPNKEWCLTSTDRAFHFPQLPLESRDHCIDSNYITDVCYETGDYNCDTVGRYLTENSFEWFPKNLVPHADSCVFILPPGDKKNITLSFSTDFPRKLSSLLYIRNNLTIIEVVRLVGESVIASLKFGNRKPGSSTPLLFDMTEKHLKDCDRDKNKKTTTPPNFTVKRTFVARNTGVIPIRVTRFFINSIECEGYGFRVLNCEPFELIPNGTHKVDIAFTPDFTLTKVQRLLILETSLNEYVNYTLVSSIPVSLAAKCAAILRRPPWEVNLLGFTVTILICIGICVLFAGCYESYKILTVMSASLLRETTVHPPFDLRAIGQITTNKKENWECCSNSFEIKPKENPSPKASNWNYDDGFSNDDSKSNAQSQKYEELNAIPNSKHRRKINKKAPGFSETVINDLTPEQDLQVKEKRVLKDQINNVAWKDIFARNTLITKYGSQSNSSDSSDTHKQATDSLQETKSEKHTKTADLPKKISNLYSNNLECNNDQSHFTNNNKKHSQLKCLSIQTHSCEEDTSSTTTESSNNDDADKENDNSTSSSSNKSITSNNCKKSTLVNSNKKAKCMSQCRDSYEGDGEDEEYDHKSQSSQSSTQNDASQRWTKNRENINISHAKFNSDIDKQKNSDNVKNVNLNTYENTNTTKIARKENSKINSKRDKQPLSKKRSLDKSFVFGNKSENNNLSTSAFNAARSSPSTPPAIATVWENRASFSDVVSRSDNSFSNSYVNRTKEPQDLRKSDQKVTSHNLSGSNSNIHSHNMNKFTIDDSRKSETKNMSHADLGPIGSNYYSKKSTSLWGDSSSDNQNRQYNSSQHAAKKSQNVSDDINLMNNSGNSFFINPNSFFTGSSYSDLTTANNSLSTTSQNGNGTSNNYGSIGSSLSSLGNQNMPRMSYISNNSSALQGMSPNHVDGMNLTSNNMSLRDLSSYEAGLGSNYGLRGSPSIGGNMLDLSANSSLLDINKGNTMSMLESENSKILDLDLDQWDRMTAESMNLIGNLTSIGESSNNDTFDTGYSSPNVYDDKLSWGRSHNLWNPSPTSTTNTTLQSSHTLTNSDVQLPFSNSANMVTPSVSSSGPAEWLWGYNNNENISTSGSSHTQSGLSSSSSQSNQFHNQSQYQHQTNQPGTAPFDPFHSINSIWSTGSSMDLWSNQQTFEHNNQDPNNHGQQNHYQ